MDWIKKNLAEMLPFLFMMAASCLFFALSVADTVKLKECNEQIVKLRQELALTQKELQVYRECSKLSKR